MWKHASFLPLMKRKDCCGGGGGGHARAREPYSQPPTPASQCSPSALVPIPPFVLPPPRQRERNTAKTHLAVHTDVGNTVVRVDTVVTEGAGIGPARSRARTPRRTRQLSDARARCQPCRPPIPGRGPHRTHVAGRHARAALETPAAATSSAGGKQQRRCCQSASRGCDGVIKPRAAPARGCRPAA